MKKDAFNVYRGFARRHGSAPGPFCRWLKELEARYLEARKVLTEAQLAFHEARNEQQGGAGPAMAPRTGKWVFPVPSVGEEL